MRFGKKCRQGPINSRPGDVDRPLSWRGSYTEFEENLLIRPQIRLNLLNASIRPTTGSTGYAPFLIDSYRVRLPTGWKRRCCNLHNATVLLRAILLHATGIVGNVIKLNIRRPFSGGRHLLSPMTLGMPSGRYGWIQQVRRLCLDGPAKRHQRVGAL